MISVNHLIKNFKVFKRPKGVGNTLKSFIHREYELKKAVNDISFDIYDGEIVGYVGPNGAGKSTTIKVLSGILTPTSGEVVVDGLVPYKSRINNAKNIGVVFGQRSQLYWDLPVRDSFVLHQRMFEIPTNIFRDSVNMFTEILQMEGFLDQPVRQLSLGQKMRANIAIALLHNPRIVYLDEPTIGLDIVAKAAIREFIKEINRKRGTTVIITTHDMTDIEQVCQRLFLIDKGTLCYDGTLSGFMKQFGDKYLISIKLKEDTHFQHPALQILEKSGDFITVRGDKKQISIAEAVYFITHNFEILEIDIKKSNVESILKDVYTGKILI